MTKQTGMWRLASNSPMVRAIVTLLLSVGALAEDPILIAVPQPALAQRAQTEALYSAVHYEIANAGNLNTKVQFLPIEEARASHERGSSGALLGAPCGVVWHTPSLYSVPYALLSRHLIAAGDSKAITGIESLRGKTLGVIGKYFYELPDTATLKAMDITLYHAQDQLTLVKLLLSKRVDVILESAAVAETLRHYVNHPAALRYVKDTPYSMRPLCYVARDDEKGKLLITRLNKGIRVLYANGKLAEFMTPPFQLPSLEQIEEKIIH